MLKITLVFLTLCTTPFSSASEQPTSKPFIYEGLMELGGSLSLQRSNNSNSFYMAPYAGYFITDRILIGGQFSFSTSTGSSNTIGLSPMIKYFFYTDGPWAAFVGHNDGVNWVDSTTTTQGTTSLGSQYFINASVAFGMSLNYIYNLKALDSDKSIIQLLGSFSIYY